MLSACSAEQLRDAEAALRGTGVEAAARVADVSDSADATRLIETTFVAYGGIEVLVNNVGRGAGGVRIADSTDEDWRGALDRNLSDRVHDAACFAAHERRTGSCSHQHRIDLRLVAAGRHVGPIRRGQGGVDFRHWALEFGPYGIRVNTISPGAISVEGNGWDRYRLAKPEHFADYVRHGFPMGRLGTADEVADVIVVVASPRAHWINGRNIPVDGPEKPHAPLDRRPY